MKKIFFIIISLLIILIISNKVAKQFLKQTKLEKIDFIENIKIVYGENYEDYIKVYKQQAYPVLYTPLTEFIERERNEEFVSVSKFGNRCNENKIKKCQVPNGGKNEIWIFGGSTAFGYGLKNNETISAHLDRFIKNKNVINFGQGYFNSTQNRIFFQNLLTLFPAPESVVFFEGYNDFKINQINNYKLPIKTSLTKDFEELINLKEISKREKLTKWFKKRFNRLNIVRLYKEKTNNDIYNKTDELLIDNVDEAYKSLVKRLKINFKINKSIGKNFNIKIINILEPISLSKENYSTSNLPTSYFKEYDKKIYHYKNIYSLIKKNNELLEVVDMNLTNIRINDKMFIDLTHYSNEFSKKIAFEIFEYLKK